MEELRKYSGPVKRKRRGAAHTRVMTLRLRLRIYRLCNVVMELERAQPVTAAVQTVAEVIALLLF